MTSIRFAGALIFLGALVSVQSEAASSTFTASSVKDLADAVSEATKSNPKLRKQDDKRKNRVIRDFAASSPSTTSRSLEDGGNDNNQDDYFSSNWNYDADYTNAEFGFALDNYSLKYTGCSTAETYSADQAADNGDTSVLVSKRFATFRLCPTSTCSDNKYQGCSSNYGDYVVSLDQFLNAMVELNEDRVTGYCTYCQECAAIESFHKWYYETTAKKAAVLSTAQQSYKSWYNSKGYGDDDANSDEGAALAYYNVKKSSSSSSSNYDSNYNSNGNSNYNSNNGNSNNNNNGGSSYSQWSNSRASWSGGNSGSSSSNSWSDMSTSQQNYGSWYGKQVVNGHYYNGEFVEEWGYFSGSGNFVTLEEDESIPWDQYLYGTYPETWDEDWIGSSADEVQSCNYQYSASCSSQYESCMRILENEDYMAYMEYVQSQSNNQNGGNSGEMSSLADFLQCTQVDQEYIEQYQQYLAWQKAMASQYAQQQNGESYADCEGDDDGCSQYSEQYQNNNNNNYDNMQLYIGPHCGEDGHTITLGVYTDATCSTYTNKFSAKDILGVDVMKANTGGSMDLFPTKCISCVTDANDSWYEGEEDAEGYEEGGVSPLCSMLYQYSGKCNKHLSIDSSSYNEYQMYQSEAQQDNEDAVCAFIEVVRSNTYNEKGQITYGFSNIFSNNGFRSGARSMSSLHKAALSILGIAVVVLMISAVWLHSQLGERDISWRPRRFARPVKGNQALMREESGVTNLRSHPTGDGVFL